MTIGNQGKVKVTVSIVPSDAVVTIDNKQVGDTVFLNPKKTYTIHAHKDGFRDVTEKQYIDSTQNRIVIGLNGVSDEAKKWEQEHQNQYLEIEGAAGKVANDEGAAFLAKNPITADLPYENLIFSIGYRIDQDDPSGNTIILTVDAPEGARNAAVQQIHDLGYNPANYKIEFNDYRNPFEL